MRQQRCPAALVPFAPLARLAAKAFPAPVFDLDPGAPGVPVGEPDLHLGRVGPVAAEVLAKVRAALQR